MTLRQPHQDASCAAADAACIRQVLVACSQLLGLGGSERRPAVRRGGAGRAEAAGLSRAPGALAGEVNLAIDMLDFSDAARSAR